MMFIKLINEGEKTEIIIGGRPVGIKKGENWFPKGTAEFITSKVANTKIVGIAVECEEDGSPIGSVKEEAIIPIEEIITPADEIILPEPEVITSEKIENKKEKTEIDKTIPETKEPITEEDLKKYEEELQTKTREELISILDFKEIKFAKNDNNKKLIKTIIKAIK